MKRILISGVAVLALPVAALAQMDAPRLPAEKVNSTVSDVVASEPACVVVRGPDRESEVFDSCDASELLDVSDAEGVAYYSDGESHQVFRILRSNVRYGQDGHRYRLVLTRELAPGVAESLPRGPIGPGPIVDELNAACTRVRGAMEAAKRSLPRGPIGPGPIVDEGINAVRVACSSVGNALNGVESDY